MISADANDQMKGWVTAINRIIENKKKGVPATTEKQVERGENGHLQTATTNGHHETKPIKEDTTKEAPKDVKVPTVKNPETPGNPTQTGVKTVTPGGPAKDGTPTPRTLLVGAKASIPFLQEPESKVLEFWQIWFESIPPKEDLTTGMGIDFHVSTSANMQKLTWRTGGPQNIFIQRMVDFFWNVGAPESEIDKLNDVGADINPHKIGSWIDMSAKGGMDGGWYFPVDITIKQAIDAADKGDAVEKFKDWCNKHGIDKCLSVGRDMGAAPPRQTEFRIKLPGLDFDNQYRVAIDAWDMFGFPSMPDEILKILKSSGKMGCYLSIITSSDGFVRLGLLVPSPGTDTVVKLCQAVGSKSDALTQFEQSIGGHGPAFIEYQYLMSGYGYGVYQEGFDVVFHYNVGEEHFF